MMLYSRRFTTEKLVEGKKKDPFVDEKLPGGDKYLDYLSLTKEACALTLLDVSNHIIRVTSGVTLKMERYPRILSKLDYFSPIRAN